MHHECVYYMIDNSCVIKDTIIFHDNMVTADPQKR
jgi:hypothetical protein